MYNIAALQHKTFSDKLQKYTLDLIRSRLFSEYRHSWLPRWWEKMEVLLPRPTMTPPWVRWGQKYVNHSSRLGVQSTEPSQTGLSWAYISQYLLFTEIFLIVKFRPSQVRVATYKLTWCQHVHCWHNLTFVNTTTTDQKNLCTDYWLRWLVSNIIFKWPYLNVNDHTSSLTFILFTCYVCLELDMSNGPIVWFV